MKPVNQGNIMGSNTQKKSITPSGYFGQSPEHIHEIENFLTQEEIDFLYGKISNNTIWDITESHFNEAGVCVYDHRIWQDRVATTDTLEKIDPEINVMLHKIIDRLKPIIEKAFNVEANPTWPALVRWPTGSLQVPHADKELHSGPSAGTPNDFPWYDLSTIFYLNDDYEGGELFFPNQSIQFKPKKGGVYFFPGDMNYIHGVRPVISGCRYTSPFFWTIDKLGKQNNE